MSQKRKANTITCRKRKATALIDQKQAPWSNPIHQKPHERKQIVITPPWLLQLLNNRYGPLVDMCPDPRPVDFDSLDPKTVWGQQNYLNPPYNNIAPFIERAIQEWETRKKGSIFLVPARVHSSWYLNFIHGKYQVIPLQGELTFTGYHNAFPFPVIIIVIGPSHPHRYEYIQQPIGMARAQGGKRLKRLECEDTFPGAFVDMQEERDLRNHTHTGSTADPPSTEHHEE